MAAQVPIPKKLWEHPDPKSTKMYRLMQHLNKVEGLTLETFQDLYTYSIAHRNTFYVRLFHFVGLLYTGTATTAVDEAIPISEVPTWFPNVLLNFAENMLYSAGPVSADAPSCLASARTTISKDDREIAITASREGGSVVEHVTWRELRARAAQMAGVLAARGVRKGERILVVAANSVDTLVVYLGTAWLGALFSSASTDMGIQGILQRAQLIDPKFIFYDDAAVYNGSIIDLTKNIAAVVKGVTEAKASSCPNFVSVVVIPRFAFPRQILLNSHIISLREFLATPSSTPEFERVGFNEPSVIYYSSGTTGTPKAIVHTVGGILLNMFKEGTLHEYRDEDSVSLQYTTTGWIMYLTAVSPLLFGGRAVLYDGSPLYPDHKTFVSLLSKFGVTKLGIGPRFLHELAKNDIKPREIADLSELEIVTSTGMVLSDELFEWFYSKGFPRHTHLANLSGGTDIAGCFGLENPLTPVYVGGTQGPALGVAVAIYDSSEPSLDNEIPVGKAISDGSPGELTATLAFPNIPCFLWGDGLVSSTTNYPLKSPGPKYTSSYFMRYRDVWAHGDFCTIHPVTGNITFLGRADGVLNPSGVRFGSAEIYAVIERSFSDRIADSLCVGRRRPSDPDEKVMLFVLMKPGSVFDSSLVKDIKQEIGKQLTKRHVPTFVFEAPEIPTTVNLKKVELPVKQIVSGQRIKPSSTLLNPGSLDFYYKFARVEADIKGRL
ncbi:hypothetical protein BROUX41_001679 [Berkeleyomyces rouxiae]|uniref:uncharacterized protein n=1 Tax=Berkeleyomyces rouxiae TaxID=2035830 RepID=UPI003B77D08A